MSSVVIFKKNLEKLGKKLMLDFFYTIHDDYLLREFEEIKLKRKFYDENLTKEFLSFCEKREINIESLYFGDKKYKDLVKMKTEDLLENLKTQIKEETLEYEIIFIFFEKMDENLKIDKQIDFELDEDLFCMKKAFIHLYNVFHFDHDYLED